MISLAPSAISRTPWELRSDDLEKRLREGGRIRLEGAQARSKPPTRFMHRAAAPPERAQPFGDPTASRSLGGKMLRLAHGNIEACDRLLRP